MAKLSVTVCDACGSLDKSTKKYRVVSDGRSATTDLCDQHGKALEEVLERSATPAGRKRFDDSVMTIEQIEASKKKR